MFESDAQLLLSPGADAAWTQAVRPWLEAGRGSLSRRLVVVPTRGQALVWKQRCVRVGLPLLGVEFITPGLARRKWLPLVAADRPVLGKEFLLFGLRGLIARRLETAADAGGPTGLGELSWDAIDPLAVWRSLRSDPERALEALDDLLQAGFAPEDFPRRELAELGVALRAWTERLGYGLGLAQAITAATAPLPRDTPPLASDVLVVGLGPENAGEFFNVAALVRRAERVTVVLPAPVLRGGADADPAERPDEAWVTRWETFLRVQAVTLEAVEAPLAGEAPAEGATTTEGTRETALSEAELLLGTTRAAEAELIAGRICAWLDELESEDADAGDIGVIFPGPGPLHRLVSARLRELGVPHHDLVGRTAAPPVDTQILRGVVEFWARGGRLDEVLALWPRLKALNLAGLEAGYGDFRAHVDERFHETCEHALAVTLEPAPGARAGEGAPDGSESETAAAAEPRRKEEKAGAADLRRLAAALLPAWEAKLTLGEAAGRLRAVAGAWGLALPEGFETLDAFAVREPGAWPREPMADLILAFLPEVVETGGNAPNLGLFAPVVLTTRRRAEGAPWGRLILAQANAGDWPRRRDPNPWLDDAARAALNRSGRGAATLMTSEEASALERAGHEALAREARGGLVVSAAARDEEEPDRALAPNGFLERLLWARGERRPQEALARLAADPRAGGPAEAAPEAWRGARMGRRDPARPFDGFFLCIDDADTIPLPERLSPSTLEKGMVDPAVLWFRGLLRIEPARREPLERAPALRRGQVAHRLLAAAVRPEGCRDGEWGHLKPEARARELLERGLGEERVAKPAGWYWDAEHGRLEALCRALLARFYATGEGDFVVVECWLPDQARLTLPGWEVPVRGRMDVARADRPGWAGARVHLYDYKSGVAEKALDAARMAEKAESLQLAIYLDAVRSLGVAGSMVWKVTAEEATPLAAEELAEALAAMPRLMEAMRTGRYGALTPDRNPHGGREPWPWPIACTPIAARDLKAKYALTFGEEADGADDDAKEAGDE